MTWLEHLLVLSMVQHESEEWGWGRYVVIHPEGNTDYADICARYRTLLVDRFDVRLDDAGGSPPLANGSRPKTVKALRERYVAD